MKFPKNKPLKNPENIAFIKKQRCMACGKKGGDAHHIQTRKSGGSDELSNLLPLDRKCHSMLHQMGQKTFAEKFNLPIDFSGIYPRRSDL